MAILTMYISGVTNTLIKDDIKEQIKKACKKYKVEVALAESIASIESKFNPFAMRHEEHLKKAKWYKRAIGESYLKNKYAYCSMGIFQIMFGTARALGYKGKPFELINPTNSIEFGIKHISQLIKRYYYLEKVVSAYNQGTPRRDKKTGKYKNQYYVNKFLKEYKKRGGKI